MIAPKYSCLLLLLVFVIKSNAQYSIKGRITNDIDTSAVADCIVMLLNINDSAKISETLTDDKGNYHFDSIAAGHYFLKTSSNSYADFSSKEIIVDKDIYFFDFLLHLKETILDEVAISTIKPGIKFKDGKIILSTADNPLASGSTVIELIKSLPGVSLDAENNITVNAKQGVRFMINEVLQQLPEAQMMVLLSNMSAESITSLELIKNPSAKYDASGTAGLINIVTRQSKIKGYNGSVIASLGMGKRFGGGSNVSLNFKSDKLNVFSNVSYIHRNPLTDFEMNRTINAGNEMQSINTKGDDVTHLYSFTVNAGLEYDISKKTMAGLNFRTLPGKSTDHFIVGGQLSNSLLPYSRTDYTTDNVDRYNNPSITFYSRHSFDSSGTQLTFTTDYTHFRYKESRGSKNAFYDDYDTEVLPIKSYNNLLDLNFNIFTQKLDFTKSIGKEMVFESGLKAAFVENSSDAGLMRNIPGTATFYNDTSFSSIYNYKEKIFAGYVNLTKTIGDFSLQGGLRAEQTYVYAFNRTNNRKLHRNYFNVFPSLNVAYKQSDKNSFQFTYSYRIDRPGYDQLNPIRLFFSELNYGTGNPNLVPQYSHNLNLDYNYNNMLMSGFAFTRYSNSIYRYTYSEVQSGIQIDTLANLASRSILSYTLTFQKQWGKVFNMQLTGMLAYCYSSGTLNETLVDNHSLMGLINSNNDFILPHKVRLQLNGRYSSPYTDGIQHFSQRGSVDIALQRRFMSDKLNVVLGIYDVLYTDYGNVKSNLPNQAYYEYAKNDSRRVRLSITYRFGNMRIERRVNNSDEEERKRIKKVD